MFVFVPAMEDIGSVSIFPRPPLFPSVTASFTKQVLINTHHMLANDSL